MHFLSLPKQSLRRRVMVLITIVMLAMAGLDLGAAHWSLQRSLFTYSQHNQADQAADWAQLMAVLYDEFGSWNQVRQHLTREAGLQIDGQKLGQIKAVIVTNTGNVIRTQSDAVIAQSWKSSPVLFHNLRVGTLYVQAYVPLQVQTLKQRIIRDFDEAQFIVLAVTSLLAFLFMTIWIRSFLKPLEQLAVSASSMTAGDFDTPLPQNGDEEIQKVVQAFSVTRQRLHETQETRRKVLADIHHELRTPLNVIANRLEAIHLGLFHWDEQTAAILQEETERIQTIVDDLEQLNDVQTGVQKMECNWVNVREWLPKLAVLFAAEGTGRSVDLQLSIPDEPLHVWMDKNRMSQVVVNLISNALRYTPAGKRIFIQVECMAQGVVLVVRDEGIGMDPQHLPFIFERFYRVEPSRNRETGGAGLGLAIVKEVVNAHGGEVTVRSLPGQGTCFRIFLPKHNPNF
ncbi:HAMP domain-containing histidine kinase [Alicyclobacillus tolerans]|uniref:sensor histidine kinase n=1 Tax=Alicyclobacillus tolerans TaxID=90970 RepID=UPI001F2D4E70|nr:HAMP domain-containing sensor histidine kinase [Alicyclobacillus tolerans]MCF8567266.1 HAMP domain-containing histidine kinase [Alicyclobacillus tolerans]